MSVTKETIDQVEKIGKKYSAGFVTDIETEKAPKGLNEDTIRFISDKKSEPEWLLNWRLKAYQRWLSMTEPQWAKVSFPEINYQDAYYYAAKRLHVKPDCAIALQGRHW